MTESSTITALAGAAEEEAVPGYGNADYWFSLIGEQEAASFLDLTDRTLQKYRRAGGGPKFCRLVETAFGWCPEGESRRLVTGVNWSPGIINPFRELGHFGQSLDTILSQQRVDRDEPVILVLHMACPRVEYTDRGKSSVVIQVRKAMP